MTPIYSLSEPASETEHLKPKTMKKIHWIAVILVLLVIIAALSLYVLQQRSAHSSEVLPEVLYQQAITDLDPVFVTVTAISKPDSDNIEYVFDGPTMSNNRAIAMAGRLQTNRHFLVCRFEQQPKLFYRVVDGEYSAYNIGPFKLGMFGVVNRLRQGGGFNKTSFQIACRLCELKDGNFVAGEITMQ